RIEDFDYPLPPGHIAQTPAARRDAARLLVYTRASGAIEQRSFGDLPALLPPHTVVVLNDTRVIPARLRAHKTTGGAVELLVLDAAAARPGAQAACLARSAKPLRAGARLKVLAPGGKPSGVEAEVLSREANQFLVRFHGLGESGLLEALATLGEVPLPPYIVREQAPGPEDAERYQTVYAREPGAMAAPTAGLHFTAELLEALRARGHEVVALTLHIGPGTFAPVRVGDPRAHTIHPERYTIPAATAAAVNRAKREGRPVLAVGPTVVRALESAAGSGPVVVPAVTAPTQTQLFIYPGYQFRVVDALTTNFHLPRSTLLMLVAALVGRERLLALYAQAVRAGYRFYSYGDAMLIR